MLMQPQLMWEDCWTSSLARRRLDLLRWSRKIPAKMRRKRKLRKRRANRNRIINARRLYKYQLRHCNNRNQKMFLLMVKENWAIRALSSVAFTSFSPYRTSLRLFNVSIYYTLLTLHGFTIHDSHKWQFIMNTISRTHTHTVNWCYHRFTLFVFTCSCDIINWSNSEGNFGWSIS